MAQQTLAGFDDELPQHCKSLSQQARALAKKTDPPTSLRAARKLVEADGGAKLQSVRNRVVAALQAINAPATQNEILQRCVEMNPGLMTREDSYRKRCSDLVGDKIIERVGERECRVTGEMAGLYWFSAT